VADSATVEQLKAAVFEGREVERGLRE